MYTTIKEQHKAYRFSVDIIARAHCRNHFFAFILDRIRLRPFAQAVSQFPNMATVTYQILAISFRPTNSPVALPLVPHIIDMKTTTGDILDTTIRVPDMTVTVLYSHSPKTLEKFLDMDRNFRFQHHYCSKDEPLLDFVIMHLGETIEVRRQFQTLRN